MEFVRIQSEEKEPWDAFLAKNAPESFLQGYGWGEFQEAVGRKVHRFAVRREGRLLAVIQAVEHRLPGRFRYWYVPRGLAVVAGQENAPAVWRFVLPQLKAAAKRGGALFVRFDPALGSEQVESLRALGLLPLSGSVQPKDTLVLDLGRSEEELLAGMKQKTRYNLRLAEKKGVEVISTGFNEQGFQAFWGLTQVTAARDGITTHPESYYRAMLQTLDRGGGDLRCRLFLASFAGEVIAANLVIYFGPYAVYLHGASGDSHRNLMAPYLLQWQQIVQAKREGCCAYDFWGITVGDANPRWAGITRFKLGFGGRTVSYAGVFDLPVNLVLYRAYRLLTGRR